MVSPELVIVAICLIGISAFFYPSFIAFKRRTHQRWAILFINIFFGWSMIGWAVALYYAYGPTEDDIRWAQERERLAIHADEAIVAMERRSREALER